MTPQQIRTEVVRLSDQAERAAASGDTAGADRLVDQANALIEEHEALTGLPIDLTGAVQPPQFSGRLELSATEQLLAAGVDPSNLTLAEQEAVAGRLAETAKEAAAAEREATVRDYLGSTLGVDVSRLTSAELGELAAANVDRLEQAALADVGVPPPEVVRGPGGERVTIDLGAEVRDFLARPIATTIPASLQDKVTLPGAGARGPEVGSLGTDPAVLDGPPGADLLGARAGGDRVPSPGGAGEGTRLPTSPTDSSPPGAGSSRGPTAPGGEQSPAGADDGSADAPAPPPPGGGPDSGVDIGEDPADLDGGDDTGVAGLVDIALWWGEPQEAGALTGNYIDAAGNLYYEDGTPMSPDDAQYQLWQAAAEREGTTLEQMGQDLHGGGDGGDAGGDRAPDEATDPSLRPEHLAAQLDAFADQHSLIRARAEEGAATDPAPDTGGGLGAATGPRLEDSDEISGFDPLVDPGEDRLAPGDVAVEPLRPSDTGDIDPPEGTGEGTGGSAPFDPSIVAADGAPGYEPFAPVALVGDGADRAPDELDAP